MTLLTSYDPIDVLRFNYGIAENAIAAMKKSIRLNFKYRNHPVCRARIKSAIQVIRSLLTTLEG